MEKQIISLSAGKFLSLSTTVIARTERGLLSSARPLLFLLVNIVLAGACANAQSQKLMECVHKYDLACVQTLIDAKADVNMKDGDGRTPLIIMSEGGKTDIVKALLGAGADVNARDKDGFSSLANAALMGYMDTVEVLLNAKADVNIKDNNGLTPLFAAIYGNSPDIVKILIASGADINTRNADECTALIFATRLWDVRNRGDRHTDIVRMLIDAGANVDLKQKNGINALMLASKEGNVTIVRMLIDAKADVNAEAKIVVTYAPSDGLVFNNSGSGNTEVGVAYDNAHKFERTEVVTAMLYASQKNYQVILQMLKDAGAVK